MIKREVIIRNQVRTIYSSELQERMKIYFDLNQKYESCVQRCKVDASSQREECSKECEKIYNDYATILKQRYSQGNQHRLDMQVKDLPMFTSRKRPDRDTWFYRLFGVSFKEMFQ